MPRALGPSSEVPISGEICIANGAVVPVILHEVGAFAPVTATEDEFGGKSPRVFQTDFIQGIRHMIPRPRLGTVPCRLVGDTFDHHGIGGESKAHLTRRKNRTAARAGHVLGSTVGDEKSPVPVDDESACHTSVGSQHLVCILEPGEDIRWFFDEPSSRTGASVGQEVVWTDK